MEQELARKRAELDKEVVEAGNREPLDMHHTQRVLHEKNFDNADHSSVRK